MKFSQGMHAPTGQQLRHKLKSQDKQNTTHKKKYKKYLDLLCLVEVVGPSVVDIVAESSSHHGKGI